MPDPPGDNRQTGPRWYTLGFKLRHPLTVLRWKRQARRIRQAQEQGALRRSQAEERP